MKNTEAKITAWIQQIESGQTLANEAKIIKFMRGRQTSDIEEMKSLLNIKHQTLTSRVSNLEDLGILTKVGKCKMDKFSEYQYVGDALKREFYSEQRKRTKCQKIISNLLTNYSDILRDATVAELELNGLLLESNIQ